MQKKVHNKRVGMGKLAVAGLCLLPNLVACAGGVGTSAGNASSSDTSESTTIEFPTGLALASPLDVTDSDTSTSVSVARSVRKSGGSGSSRSKYSWAVDVINDILSGTSPSHCTFEPALFLQQDHDADCYGPTVQYENHPDDPAMSGQLPSGDVGIFLATDPTDGHACTASQLNARMSGVESKSLAALTGLAGLVCAADAAGLSAPSNSTLDLTAVMTALGIVDTTFTGASVTHDDSSGTAVWSYDMDLEYTDAGTPHHVVIAMTHIPGASAGEYAGRLTLRVNETFTGGNCPSSDVTNNISLLYNSASTTDMNVEVRQGSFCGSDVDGTVDGLTNAADKYDAASNVDGWGNNFSVLTAQYDPTNLVGHFSYAWQAGPNDGNTRVLNVATTEDAGTGIPAAVAFVGYGDDVDGADGAITGMICNWAGPNASHTVQDFAQSQTIEFDTATGTFVETASNLTYAITNSCDYDGAGTFTYDSDLDGIVDTDPAVAIANDLQSLTDADLDGDFDEIEAAGFTLPTAPANI